MRLASPVRDAVPHGAPPIRRPAGLCYAVAQTTSKVVLPASRRGARAGAARLSDRSRLGCDGDHRDRGVRRAARHGQSRALRRHPAQHRDVGPRWTRVRLPLLRHPQHAQHLGQCVWIPISCTDSRMRTGGWTRADSGTARSLGSAIESHRQVGRDTAHGTGQGWCRARDRSVVVGPSALSKTRVVPGTGRATRGRVGGSAYRDRLCSTR